MNKEDLQKRIAELNLEINKVQAALNEMMASHNAMVGARDELGYQLNKMMAEEAKPVEGVVV